MSHYECKDCYNRYDSCTCFDTKEKTEALKSQVDGTHYSKLKIQPLELAYRLNASPCFTKLAKYITRDKDDKSVQFDKAIHCIRIEKDLISDDNLYGIETSGYGLIDINGRTDITDFCNQFQFSDTMKLALLAMYAEEYDAAIQHTKDLRSLEIGEAN